jgi:hypothetical protein
MDGMSEEQALAALDEAMRRYVAQHVQCPVREISDEEANAAESDFQGGIEQWEIETYG